MTDPVADLHAHTTVSDGTLTLEEVPEAAHEGGVEWVAVTDHDRIHPGLDAPVTEMDGVTVVRGIELRVETDFGRVDLLGYGVRETPDLTAEINRLQRDRAERGQKIIESVEAELGVDLGIEPREGLGRPHIARAIKESDADYGYDDAFDELIGSDGPCFVAREVTPFAEGKRLLDDACEIVGLAHPLRYDDPEAALALTEDLDAVELYYPYDRPMSPDGGVDRTPVREAIERYDLLATGGSDAHDRTLGVTGVPESAFDPIRKRLRKTHA